MVSAIGKQSDLMLMTYHGARTYEPLQVVRREVGAEVAGPATLVMDNLNGRD